MKRNIYKIISTIAIASIMNNMVSAVALAKTVSSNDNVLYQEINNSKILQQVTNDKIEISEAANYGLAKNIKDGVILQAFCWSFNTIKDNMKEIAEAGYTSVQTSPANECFKGDGGGLAFGKPGNRGQGGGGCWYYHYQPTDYKIGNYQLGTRDDFKAMCDEAKKYGVKIIVDVVANHTTEYEDNIAQSLKNIDGGLYHSTGHTGIGNYGDRFQCTQQAMCNGGLPDINTENKAYQNYLMAYLKDCIACGASGFRYDAAKHIGLPDDPSGGDFWPTILNNGTAFQYGEVLQGDNERIGAYAGYMGVTASEYGKKIRGMAGSKNLEANGIADYSAGGISADKLVTWVESHDNYCNDDGSTCGMSDDVIRIAWGCLVARKGTTPLFFSRPVGSGGPGKPKFSEQTKMGDKGSDFFKDPAIAGVNKFRNAMVGEDEKLSNCGNDCLVVARGNKGVAFINAGSEKDVEANTSMPDGQYKDQVSGEEFVVASGKIKGKVSGNTIACVYKVDGNDIDNNKDEDTKKEENTKKDEDKKSEDIKKNIESDGKNVAYLKLPSGWDNAYAYVYIDDPSAKEVTSNGEWPGIQMEKVSEGLYKYEVPSDLKDGLIIFNGGKGGPQYPAAKMAGLKCQGSMICDGSSWDAYDDGSSKKQEEEEDKKKEEEIKKQEEDKKKEEEVKKQEEDKKKEEEVKKQEEDKKKEEEVKKQEEDKKKEEEVKKQEENKKKEEKQEGNKEEEKSKKAEALELDNFKISPNSNIKVGDTIKINVKASGGSGEYKYYIYAKNGKTKIKITNGYTENSSMKWEAQKNGTYKIYVEVKDSDGNKLEKEVYKTIKVTDSEDSSKESIYDSEYINEGDRTIVLGGMLALIMTSTIILKICKKEK